MMVAQTIPDDKAKLNDVNIPKGMTPKDLPQGRKDVSQQEITPGGGGNAAPPVSPKAQPTPVAQPGQQQKPQNSADFDADACSQFYFSVLKSKGILFRQITKDAQNRMFDTQLPNREGITKGSFYIPGKKENGEPVTVREAAEIKNIILEKFSLTAIGESKRSNKASGWVVNWSTAPEEDLATLQDDVSKYVGLNPYEGEEVQKAAMTMSEILKESQEERFGALMKFASTKKPQQLFKTAAVADADEVEVAEEDTEGPLTMSEILASKRNDLFETMKKIAKEQE